MASARAVRMMLAVRVGLWLFALPLRWRTRSLPALLERITPAPARKPAGTTALDETLQVVARVCRLRVFSLRVYPRVCLREALALYQVLRRMGHPAVFCVGVRKDGDTLVAHSWVTLHGAAVMPWSAEPSFSILFVYPPTTGFPCPASNHPLR